VPVDEMGYKKKYIARKIQENEAEREIKTYHQSIQVPDAQDVDEERSVRNVSS
jgi:hypothetical protein